ncbi:MAG: hypothetical protein ABIF19_01540 [Planctomycetota bacterium]
MNTLKIRPTISVFDRVRELLEQDRPQDALNLIEHVGQNTPAMKNAQGVCLLRLGRIEDAICVLREIAFQGHVCIPSDTPAVYQANFATAMLMANHKDGAIDLIKQLDAKRCPAVAELKAAIDRWEKSMPLVRRLLFKIGIYPSTPMPIDFVLGDLG